MKTAPFIFALVLPAAALGSESAPAGPGFHERLYSRYCEALREGPESYARFVHRLRLVYGYTVDDFARRVEGAPVVAECSTAIARVAQAPAKDGEKSPR